MSGIEAVDPAVSMALASAQIAIEAAATALDAAQRAVMAVTLMVQETRPSSGGTQKVTCPSCGGEETLDVTTMGSDGPQRLCGGCGHQWSPTSV